MVGVAGVVVAGVVEEGEAREGVDDGLRAVRAACCGTSSFHVPLCSLSYTCWCANLSVFTGNSVEMSGGGWFLCYCY